MDVKILHGYRYITPQHAIRLIRAVPRICSTRSYLDCVTTWHEATVVCSKFADALQAPHLRDPDLFLEEFGTAAEDESLPIDSEL